MLRSPGTITGRQDALLLVLQVRNALVAGLDGTSGLREGLVDLLLYASLISTLLQCSTATDWWWMDTSTSADQLVQQRMLLENARRGSKAATTSIVPMRIKVGMCDVSCGVCTRCSSRQLHSCTAGACEQTFFVAAGVQAQVHMPA